LSLLPAIAVFLLSPTVFPLILGDQWVDAGLYASALSVYLVATIVAVPTPAFINVFERQLEFLIWNAIRNSFILILILYAESSSLSPLEFIYVYSFLMLFFHFGVL